MAITVGTLGAGRVGLRDLFEVAMTKVPKEYETIVGNHIISTTQESEVFKQFKGLGAAKQTPEGDDADFDDMAALYSMVAKPKNYTKSVMMSRVASLTDQYGVLKSITPKIARSFVQARNAGTADLDNSGFTTTNYGQNTETLYSAAHQMGDVYSYNRPLVPGSVPGSSAVTQEVAFSPLGLERAFSDLHSQIDARGFPYFPLGKSIVKVPQALINPARRAIRATQLAGGPFNDPNVIRDEFMEPKMIHYYTSSTAWFVVASDPEEHGLFMLNQMPYDIEKLPLGKDIMERWVAYESWIVGWYEWHGTWGTQGA